MAFVQTEFPGLIVIEPTVFSDSRGYFFESYNQQVFEAAGLQYHWVQDNQSSSVYGVIRGLHFQKGAFAQAKLVRCLAGNILDVVVDLRRQSPTFRQVFYIELSADNKKSLLVPRGFAHGFSVLSESAEVLYKCDNFYSKPHEGGILFNDPALNINWEIPRDKVIVSEKDLLHPTFDQLPEDSFF